MGAMQVASGEAFQRARHWANMPADERKRRASEAARDRDVATLWSLTESHLMLHGAHGAKLSMHTIRSYRTGVTQLLAAWSGEAILRPSSDAAALWLRDLETEGRSASTLRVRLAAARALYAALRWCGATKDDPFADAKPAKDPTPRHEKRFPYEAGEVQQLLEVAADDDDQLLVLLGGRAGLRVSEIVALEWSDIAIGRGELTVQSGKGGKRRRVPLAGSLVAALSAIPADRRSGPVIRFRSSQQARRRIEKLCSLAGVEYKALHSLRHSCGTQVLRRGGTLLDAARMLGHSSVSTAEVYAKWADDDLRKNVAGW